MINLFINRVFRAIKIDIDLYEEVEKDKKATFQAGIVVCYQVLLPVLDLYIWELQIF